MKKIGLYELSVIVFFIFLPIMAAVIEMTAFNAKDSLLGILLKWFVFSGVGVRLFSSGIKQATQPAFTAKEIFEITDKKCYPIVRELGFANICFGVVGIMSLFFPSFRYSVGIAGGLYFCLAGLMHVFRAKTSNREIFAMVSDFYIFAVLALLLIVNAA